MSDRERDREYEAERNFVEWLSSLGGNSAEIIKGIYSTPWTAIPFTISVLAIAETKFPGVTNAFWASLDLFFARIGVTLGNALSQVGKGISQDLNSWLKNLGANPSSQPPPPPPPPAGTPHAWFAHTTGYTAFQLNQTVASFTTQADRDKWVSDTNGSILSHLVGNYVNETWDQDLDANGNPIDGKQNDLKLPPPKPWWIIV